MLIACDSGQNCQQYENEINKSVAGREMKEAAGKRKRERDRTRQNKTRETKRAQDSQRKGRKGVPDGCRSMMKDVG